jgi:hypothetical protein
VTPKPLCGCAGTVGEWGWYEFHWGKGQVLVATDSTHLFLAPVDLALTNAMPRAAFSFAGEYPGNWQLWRRSIAQ